MTVHTTVTTHARCSRVGMRV